MCSTFLHVLLLLLCYTISISSIGDKMSSSMQTHHPQLLQVELASKASAKYGVGFAIRCREGVVLAKAVSISSKSATTRILEDDSLEDKQASPLLFEHAELGAVGVSAFAYIKYSCTLQFMKDWGFVCYSGWSSSGCSSTDG